jgi:hypothetical protein
MSGFSKLHSSIATSSLMALPVATRWLWTFLLSQANREGIVEGSISGLAIAAHITIEECQAAFEAFLAPDQYSRTKDLEGRRLVAVEDGWQIVSYGKWRHKLSAEDRAEKKVRTQRERRDRERQSRLAHAESTRMVAARMRSAEAKRSHVKSSEAQ